MTNNNRTIFLDVACPICGKTAGNSGQGWVCRCACGWQGAAISEHDKKLIEEILAEHREKNKEK